MSVRELATALVARRAHALVRRKGPGRAPIARSPHAVRVRAREAHHRVLLDGSGAPGVVVRVRLQLLVVPPLRIPDQLDMPAATRAHLLARPFAVGARYLLVLVALVLADLHE